MQRVSIDALLALLPEWMRREESLHKLDKRTVDILTRRAKDSKKNQLLERFLADQTIIVSTTYAELRSDLKPLPRIGRPPNSPTISSRSGCSIASMALTSDVLDRSEYSDCDRNEHGGKKQTLLQLPGLSFADYVWATSASRKMRIEAIFI